MTERVNLTGAIFHSNQTISLPVIAGEVTGVGETLEAAIKDALEKRRKVAEFAAKAMRVMREVEPND